ncbi:bifunctional lysylphosphatidylglycerol flippase/synthetase MprF [Noviherbaspirillum sp.]|uniref:bifunctional lysylphosphatidylglycerol flippase/synthetase MprF n=1 Tax=Noviherbaspirillum sp. TaxID=1926288 RepID=UPI002B475BB5|nr:bifunctional lysylphosphatidylglycerol flippase/synthetase MprF [Noviherbaspirillum sp.]HJV80927.1 bifunctional lysylphosphatidylglycerol flippase/synthetase MprF [Noviherbaspirillum sp.]HJW55768.1 bifunctional lysylphosphatidylglycerol flippase/synthetase MprF [Burkholderiaceae bacterium]
MPRLLQRIGPFVGLAIFGLALLILNDWLRTQPYLGLKTALSTLPTPSLVDAASLAVAGYAVLTAYDLLGLRFIGRRLSVSTAAATSFIANALGNNFGNTLITGSAVRYWIYTSAGLSTSEIARVVLFCSVGFWLGFLFVGATVFVLFPVNLPAEINWAGATTRPLGLVFFALLAAYLMLIAMRGRLMPEMRNTILPSLAFTLGQIMVASLDLCLMASVFYALLPSSADIGFARCLTVFLVALVAGNVSLVPGGLGVFESAVVLLLGQRVAAIDLAGALLMFRLIYFVAPLVVAAALAAIRARAGSLWHLRGMVAKGSRFLVAVAPQILAATVFVAGAVLLFSGSVPAAAGRLEALNHVLSLPLIEASHFVASLAGAVLLLLARALQRRLDAAWHLAVLLLGAGAALSLSKGWDFEEASVLVLACLALLSLRRQFYRKSSLLGERFSAAWTAAIVIVMAASSWLVFFAYGNASYAEQSWWTFALHAEASRSLRATVGAMVLIAMFALYRLLRPMQPVPPLPEVSDLERVRPLVERSTATYANLVLRGDKAVLFSAAKDAFLMYGRRGRSWIAMGDPVGADKGARELLWQFHDLCDRFDGWCVFFEVGQKWRTQYAELGLGLTPLGEEARVALADFDIGTPTYKRLRQARARMQRQGCSFDILPREAVHEVLPSLAQISEAWLAGKATQEKGFSNASFDVDYLKQFPLGVVTSGGKIIAFANLWLGADKEELSVDLMRHLPSAPNGTMDLLFCELMLWGRKEGFKWFNLGMAPLSGLAEYAQMPIWRSLGTLLYRHGEHFYNFEGLRHYKAKFHPVWRPLYLASPGGVALPAILVDVAALMAGSVPGIISKRGAAAQERSCDDF